MDSSEYLIEYRETAKSDIYEIYDYIAVKLKNPRAAERIQNEIFDAISYVKKDHDFYPVIGNGPYRKCPVEGYVAIHYVDHKQKIVYVEEIVNSLQNYMPRYCNEENL